MDTRKNEDLPPSMRVAVAYDCFFPLTTGGGERQYVGFANSLVKQGHQVDYLTASQPAEFEPQDFRVVKVSPQLKLYDANGVRRTPAALVFAWGVFTALLRRRRDYDVVIVSALPVLNVFAARAALLGTRTTVVCDYLEVWGKSQWREYAGLITGSVAWLAQRLAIALTPIATCHSQLSASRLVGEGLKSQPLVSPGLIDSRATPEFAPHPAEPPYVLYAGRHIPDKRVECLPAAIRLVREKCPQVELVILGSGPTTQRVLDNVAQEGAQAWTRLPGFVSQSELDALMAGAAALVNPSRREGYGLVVVEAAGHGTPSVLIHDPGNASVELVIPGVNGEVANSAEATELAQAVVRIIEAGDGIRASTRAWFDDAIENRTIDKTVENLIEAVRGHKAGAKRG